ncbi:Putative F-box/LRR-repeat protein At5g02930 [Linum perenne]
MVRRTKKIQEMKGIDRLSNLPDCILHQILSFMDTKSSIQTCILSRRWRSLWKYVPVLTFNQSSFRSNRGFEQYVDKVLSLRSDCSSISKVTIDYHNKEKHLFARVMKYAAFHGVQDLFVHSSSMRSLDVVVSVCYSYQSLKVLELNYIYFDKNAVGLWSCLQLLESLTLIGCRFVFRDAAYDAFNSFPRLETLKLDRCSAIANEIDASVLKVTAPKLLNLEITVPGFYSFEIVAPKLQSFTLEIDPYCNIIVPDVSESNLPSLDRANIKLLNWHDFMDTSSSSDNDYTRRMMIDRCTSLFKILHNVRVLDLQVEAFELLVEVCNLANREASPFERIKSLSLKHSEKSLDIVPDQVISYFLGESPNEEDKHFTVEYVRLTGIPPWSRSDSDNRQSLTRDAHLPRLLLVKPEVVKQSDRKVEETGLDKQSSMFLSVVTVVCSVEPEKWEEKLNLLKEFGFTDEDNGFAFKRDPKISAIGFLLGYQFSPR